MSTTKFFISSFLIYLIVAGWSVNTWVSLWMLIEVSFVFFLGLLSFDSSYKISEMMFKYFLVQVFAGIWLLTFIILSSFFLVSLVSWGVMLSLSIKMGLAPVHFWSISVLGKMGWLSLYFMLSFMKLLPLVFVGYLGDVTWFNLGFWLSAVVGSIGGISNVSIQKILGYSSMSGVSWLSLSSILGSTSVIVYFFSYLCVLGVICYFAGNFSVYYVSQFKFSSFSSTNKIYMFMISLVFSSMPPFIGFIMKWWLSWSFIFSGLSLTLVLFVWISLFSLIFYFQLHFYFFLINSFTLKWYSCTFSFSMWSSLVWFIFSSWGLVFLLC